MSLFFFQAEDGIRDRTVTGVQTCALPIFRFESGFEVWAYQFGPQKRRLGKTEFVVLFGPSGLVTRTLLRQIGRASCRERGWVSGVGGAVEKRRCMKGYSGRHGCM